MPFALLAPVAAGAATAGAGAAAGGGIGSLLGGLGAGGLAGGGLLGGLGAGGLASGLGAGTLLSSLGGGGGLDPKLLQGLLNFGSKSFNKSAGGQSAEGFPQLPPLPSRRTSGDLSALVGPSLLGPGVIPSVPKGVAIGSLGRIV